MKIENKEFYTQQDIENYVTNNLEYNIKIYNSVKEMGKDHNLEEYYNCETILDFTDSIYNSQNYKCYFINKGYTQKEELNQILCL